jgi:hypothetical protein
MCTVKRIFIFGSRGEPSTFALRASADKLVFARLIFSVLSSEFWVDGLGNDDG